jgi:hypothetical protein
MAAVRRLIAGLAILVVASGSARAEIIDRILAVVDTQIITLSDVRAALRFGLVPEDVSLDPTGAVLQRLIDRRLMLIEVDRYAPPEPADPAVNASLAAAERRFTDALAFEIALTQMRSRSRSHSRSLGSPGRSCAASSGIRFGSSRTSSSGSRRRCRCPTTKSSATIASTPRTSRATGNCGRSTTSVRLRVLG